MVLMLWRGVLRIRKVATLVITKRALSTNTCFHRGRQILHLLELAERGLGLIQLARLGRVADSFELGLDVGLRTDGVGDVAFLDLIDSVFVDQTTCDEAVFVRVLDLNSGAMVELNNVNLYCGRRTSTPGSLSFVSYGELINVPTGNSDGDGDVDESNHVNFADCMSRPNAPPAPILTTTRQCFDVFNLGDDGNVDASDFGERGLLYSS